MQNSSFVYRNVYTQNFEQLLRNDKYFKAHSMNDTCSPLVISARELLISKIIIIPHKKRNASNLQIVDTSFYINDYLGRRGSREGGRKRGEKGEDKIGETTREGERGEKGKRKEEWESETGRENVWVCVMENLQRVYIVARVKNARIVRARQDTMELEEPPTLKAPAISRATRNYPSFRLYMLHLAITRR